VAPPVRDPASVAASLSKNVIVASSAKPGETLICFSHLRWDFVFQRPQHLMTRFARGRRVFYFEEPLGFQEGQTEPDLWMQTCERTGVIRLVPRLPAGLDERARNELLRSLLDGLVAREGVRRPVLWYYTPMMLEFSRHLAAGAVVYDCMDELANFKGAPPALIGLERELFAKADLVTTGGYSLYEAKREQHGNVHAFPSSVDREHLAQARNMTDGDEPADQAAIEHPRLGFYGVIDERMDLEMIDRIAEARPDWALVMVGPVVKIDEADLPRRPNIHYLGGKSYASCRVTWRAGTWP
jgi:UDP-galactopyranose mutase